MSHMTSVIFQAIWQQPSLFSLVHIWAPLCTTLIGPLEPNCDFSFSFHYWSAYGQLPVFLEWKISQNQHMTIIVLPFFYSLFKLAGEVLLTAKPLTTSVLSKQHNFKLVQAFKDQTFLQCTRDWQGFQQSITVSATEVKCCVAMIFRALGGRIRFCIAIDKYRWVLIFF